MDFDLRGKRSLGHGRCRGKCRDDIAAAGRAGIAQVGPLGRDARRGCVGGIGFLDHKGPCVGLHLDERERVERRLRCRGGDGGDFVTVVPHIEFALARRDHRGDSRCISRAR